MQRWGMFPDGNSDQKERGVDGSGERKNAKEREDGTLGKCRSDGNLAGFLICR